MLYIIDSSSNHRTVHRKFKPAAVGALSSKIRRGHSNAPAGRTVSVRYIAPSLESAYSPE